MYTPSNSGHGPEKRPSDNSGMSAKELPKREVMLILTVGVNSIQFGINKLGAGCCRMQSVLSLGSVEVDWVCHDLGLRNG